MNYPAIAAELRALRIELRELRIMNGTADTQDYMDHMAHIVLQEVAAQAYAAPLELGTGMYQGFWLHITDATAAAT